MNILILATRLVIASTGAMLIVGHEAPCRISALACRIESRDYTDKQGNSRQVSGTSNASKTQSMLIVNSYRVLWRKDKLVLAMQWFAGGNSHA